ncbi:CopD family protein [Hydrogenovibrio kuenenii]|uniref:CopD family protein n=1 Tax=Hydrogenovibrio kuenenii TaxID=63658 RepID=UPI000467D325|nr:CopD family protein [Hydrogenovibrio kuenenii]
MQYLYVLTMFVHLLAAIFWVGGIFLVYMVFRPVAMTQLEPPQRLTMFLGIFSKFFPWVWVFIVALVISGYTDWIFRLGGFESPPLYLLAMEIIGWIMIVLFAWLYFGFCKRFKKHIEDENFAEAGKVLNSKMRPIIITNLILGMLEALIGVSAHYFF